MIPELLEDGNLAEGWEKFKREFTQFLIATEKSEADTKVKTAILLRIIGPRRNDIYENFTFTGENAVTDKTNYDKIIEEFEKFCKPQDEQFISRHRLLCMKQEGLSIEEFETKLRN